MLELVRIYQRLRDTMRINALETHYDYPSVPTALIDDLTHTDTLARSLGYSIAAVEIAQRGVESEAGPTLLNKTSPQTLTHLRILSETVSSYSAIGGLRSQGSSKTSQEFAETETRQQRQLFIGHPHIYDQEMLSLELKNLPSLLKQDAFIFLAECSICLVPLLNLDIHHILRLCYLAEIVRVVVAFVRDMDLTCQLAWRFAGTLKSEAEFPHNLQHSKSFSGFIRGVVKLCQDAASEGDIESLYSHPEGSQPTSCRMVGSTYLATDDLFHSFLYIVVSKYALAFVRKAAILMHVRFGVDFPDSAVVGTNEPELQRLSNALCLPTVDEMFACSEQNSPSAYITRSIVTGWIRHWIWSCEGKRLAKPMLTLSHPSIFELVGLPMNYDTLTDEATRRKCPTTGKELTDPSVCLFCGEIFCGQAVCCMKDGSKGGCFQHQAR